MADSRRNVKLELGQISNYSPIMYRFEFDIYQNTTGPCKAWRT